MRKLYVLLFLCWLAPHGYGQFTSPSVTLHLPQTSNQTWSHGKAKGALKQCGQDTLDFGYDKLIANLYTNNTGSTLRAINISDGYRLGQLYSAPDTVTISGFKFYAWSLDTTANAVDVYCEIYEAGADSLPSGTPVRADTLQIDTTFGNGVLDNIVQFANFEPYTTTKPYIVVVRSFDSTRVAIVCNDYTKQDGFADNFACGSIGGRWYRCLDLNIGGTTLDCDMLLEPFVSYKLYNDFSFKDCYDYRDSVKFTNTSSPFYFNPQYNAYKFYQEYRNLDYERFCHRWSYGSGFFYSAVHGGTKFPSGRNLTVGVRSILYSMTGFRACEDTATAALHFQPDKISFSGDTNVCSGNKAMVIANTNSNVNWHRGPIDTTIVSSGPDYETSALQMNDTIFAQGVNFNCKSLRKRHITKVTETPGLPDVKDDSICLNSLANLVAESQIGETRWFEDSTSLVTLHSGDFLQVGPLNQDTAFFAKTFNGKCTHPGRVRVRAVVSNAFAPKEPTVSNDTAICLLSGDLELSASGDNTLRWFDQAAGGKSLNQGGKHTFTPTDRGSFYRYVDSYNGICASSRLPIKIDVHHFATLNGLVDKEACEGEDIELDLSELHGDIRWFDAPTGGNEEHLGRKILLPAVSNTDIFWLESFEGNCSDSLRYPWIARSIPYGKISESMLDTQACDGTEPVLYVKPDRGDVTWYDASLENKLYVGDSLSVGPFTETKSYAFSISNEGCVGDTTTHTVIWRVMPDANFDYQVTWRDVIFASRLIDQGDYIWYFDDGGDTLMGTDVTRHYYEDKTYNVSLVVKSPFGCVDSVTKPVTINSLSVENKAIKAIAVYPNPSTGTLNISLPIGAEAHDLQLMNALGEVVWRSSGEVSKELTNMHLSVDPGVYQLLVRTQSETMTTPVLFTR